MTDFPRLDARIATVAAREPDRTAVVSVDGELTFGDLWARSGATADVLAAHGVVAGDFVAVEAPPGPAAIVGMLAAWRADAGYVSIEPDCPPGRRTSILAAARPRVRLDAALAATPTGHDGPPARGSTPAYAMFTSGSTGRPKGVRVGMRALSFHASAVAPAYGLGPTDRVLHAASLMFDVSAEEIWPTLVNGGAVVVLDRPLGAVDYRALDAFLHRHRVTVANLPAAYFAGWSAVRDPAAGATLRLVVTGSEPLPPAAAGRWVADAGNPPLLNAYGTAETAITSVVGRVTGGDGAVPIGRPLPGVGAALVDADLCAVADGEVGELLLSGPGVADGYLDDPAATAARFVVRDGVRWYRTGDRARRHRGDLVFIGRDDDQVKLRGRRLELGEVAAAVLRCDGITDVRVLPVDDHLVACVCGPRDWTAAELRAALADTLFEHAIPVAVVRFDTLPTLPGGKVDLAALRAAAERGAATATALTADGLVGLCREILADAAIGPDSDFFDAGGTSLHAARLASGLRRRHGITVPLATIFATPRLSDLAAALAPAE